MEKPTALEVKDEIIREKDAEIEKCEARIASLTNEVQSLKGELEQIKKTAFSVMDVGEHDIGIRRLDAEGNPPWHGIYYGFKTLESVKAHATRLAEALEGILYLSEHENPEHNWCIPYRNLKQIHGETEQALATFKKFKGEM